MLIGIESFTPVGRIGHSTTLVNNKLYFFGGDCITNVSNEIFYLDLSKSFDVNNPSWTLSNDNIPFGSAWASVESDKAGKNIYLFGGYMLDVNSFEDSFTSFVHRFNVDSSKWDIPSVSGDVPARRGEMKAIRAASDNIYIFGGSVNHFMGAPHLSLFRDMLIFDPAKLSWSYSAQLSPAPPVASYAAMLYLGGSILYIGGYNSTGDNIDISMITVYSTKTSRWSINRSVFTGERIENRSGHSAVLDPSNRIIVYGGVNNNYYQASPAVAVLSARNDQFEWTVPTINSNIGDVHVPSLSYHSADMFQNYMIVAFGNVTLKDRESLELNPNIYVMDTRNFTWVSSLKYEVKNNQKIIIGAIVGSVVALLGILCIFFTCRRRRNSKNSDVSGNFYKFW